MSARAPPPLTPSAVYTRPSLTPSAVYNEQVIFRAQDTPGPDTYGAPKLAGIDGGRFSSAFPMSTLELEIKIRRDNPGPGQYQVRDARPPPQTAE